METIKYFLWLNAERCGMFFSSLVLLVEGPTERMIIDYFFDIGKLDMPKGGVFVLDCLGKFNIHRFMNILGPLKINHAVLFDADNEKPPHEKIIKLIKGSSNDYTKKIDVFPEDIEKFLEIEKSKKAHRKPQHLMLKINEGKIEDKNIELLLEKLRTLIN
jgi:predicted ATP-dependent endonuclease of OLD family